MYNVSVKDYGNSFQVRVYEKGVFDSHVRTVPEQLPEQLPDQNEHKSNTGHSAYVSKSRTVQKLYDYCNCNVWEQFITLTFSPDCGIDRFNFDECSKKLRVWLNNHRRENPNLKYVAVPEKHKNGAFHFHLLVSGFSKIKIKSSGLCSFGKRTYRISDKLLKRGGKEVFNIIGWKYGFSTMTYILDSQKAISYITKYVSKDLIIDLPNKHRYFVSNNLKLPEIKQYSVKDLGRLIYYLTENADYMKSFYNDYSGEIFLFNFDNECYTDLLIDKFKQ